MSIAARAGLIGLVSALSSVAHAGALNPWYGRLGDGDAAITPYVYVLDGGAVDASVYVQTSFARHFDLLVGAGGSMVPSVGSAMSTVDLMPRVYINDNIGGTIRTKVSTTGGGVSVGPELHTVHKKGSFTFASNVGYVDRVAYALFAPEFSLSDRFSLFVEVNPTVEIGGAVALMAVPGFGLAIDKEARHTCALGLQVPTLDPDPLSVGLWYSTSIGG